MNEAVVELTASDHVTAELERASRLLATAGIMSFAEAMAAITDMMRQSMVRNPSYGRRHETVQPCLPTASLGTPAPWNARMVAPVCDGEQRTARSEDGREVTRRAVSLRMKARSTICRMVSHDSGYVGGIQRMNDDSWRWDIHCRRCDAHLRYERGPEQLDIPDGDLGDTWEQVRALYGTGTRRHG